MKKVVSSVPKARFDRFGVSFPAGWDVKFLSDPISDESFIAACKDASYLLVESIRAVPAAVINASKHLKLIHAEGVGFDKIDVEAAKAAGVPVANNRAVNNVAVAEHTIGLILAALRRTAITDAAIKAGQYAPCREAFFATGEHELASMHLGLVGIGAIGKEVARRLIPWGCKVSYFDTFRPTAEVEKELQVDYMELDDLIKTCDIISLHVPVLPSTVNMMNAQRFAEMKETALLINTGRGELIDNAALAEALEKGRIYGAALDVVSPEPPPADHPLLHLSRAAEARITLTPHIGGTTDEAFTRMLKNAIANFERVEAGEQPVNLVY